MHIDCVSHLLNESHHQPLREQHMTPVRVEYPHGRPRKGMFLAKGDGARPFVTHISMVQMPWSDSTHTAHYSIRQGGEFGGWGPLGCDETVRQIYCQHRSVYYKCKIDSVWNWVELIFTHIQAFRALPGFSGGWGGAKRGWCVSL